MVPFDFDSGSGGDDGGTITVIKRSPGNADETLTIPANMTVDQFKREFNMDSYTLRISGNLVEGSVRMSDGDVISCTAPMKAGA